MPFTPSHIAAVLPLARTPLPPAALAIGANGIVDLSDSSFERMRVDVRVLQLIYALPLDGHRLFSGQQIDAFVPAKGARR